MPSRLQAVSTGQNWPDGTPPEGGTVTAYGAVDDGLGAGAVVPAASP